MSKKENTSEKKVSPNDLDWTDHVLGLLSEDEKIMGNPTTDGLRRIFELALNCTILNAESTVVQSPSTENERRATVVHSVSYILNDEGVPQELKYRSASGAADVYWGNCDKIYRNHPVAVAETRAEGRALRRALKLRKVVAAEEISKEADTEHLDESNLNKINKSQINFIDVFGKRLNINIKELLKKLNLVDKKINLLSHDEAVTVIKNLSEYQQTNTIEEEIKNYDPNWYSGD